LPGMAAFCGIPTANQGRKKNVPTGETGGASGIRTLGTYSRLQEIAAPSDRVERSSANVSKTPAEREAAYRRAAKHLCAINVSIEMLTDCIGAIDGPYVYKDNGDCESTCFSRQPFFDLPESKPP
jgi:hypothetical protein